MKAESAGSWDRVWGGQRQDSELGEVSAAPAKEPRLAWVLSGSRLAAVSPSSQQGRPQSCDGFISPRTFLAFPFFSFPSIRGFASFRRGSAVCSLAPLQSSRQSLSAAFCLQPEISTRRMGRLEISDLVFYKTCAGCGCREMLSID